MVRRSEGDFELIFEEPPASSVRVKDTELIANLKKLLDHPERWARVGWWSSNKTAAANRKRSLEKSPPFPGTWEYRAWTEGDGSKLAAQYLGMDGSPSGADVLRAFLSCEVEVHEGRVELVTEDEEAIAIFQQVYEDHKALQGLTVGPGDELDPDDIEDNRRARAAAATE